MPKDTQLGGGKPRTDSETLNHTISLHTPIFHTIREEKETVCLYVRLNKSNAQTYEANGALPVKMWRGKWVLSLRL